MTRKIEPWWQLEGKNAAERMLDHVNSLRMSSGYSGVSRQEELVAWRAMYLDRSCHYFEPMGIGRDAGTRSPYNLTQGGVDSVHAKVTLTRPRPNIIAVGGRWKDRRKATLLQRWIDGWYEHAKAFDLLSDLVHDALIYGTGWIKVYGFEGRVEALRVWDGDILTDPREERFGTVRTLYHRAAVDKSTLIAKYPKKAKEIESAEPVDLSEAMPFDDLRMIGDGAVLDLVTVVEAYRLGASKDKPGRRMVTIKGAVLEDEDWECETFPFVCFRWGRDPERRRGQGIVERGAGVQFDIDEHSTVVQRAYDTFVPKLMIPADCNVSSKKINDEVGQAIVFTGPVAPTVSAPPAVSPDFLNREESLASRWYRVTGVGEMEANSQAPANLESGKAILAYQDVTSTRFAPQGRAYENASVDFARLVMWVADGLADDEGDALQVYGEEYAEIIDYKDVKMDRDQYVVRVFPASKLPDSIAGRLEQIGNLSKLGILTDPQQMASLLDMPDLEHASDLTTALRQHVGKEIDRCLDGEQGQPSSYLPPEELQHAKTKANAELHLALLGGGDEDDPEAMEMLRNFIGLCDQELTKAEAMAPPMPAEPVPPGPAGPAPIPMTA